MRSSTWMIEVSEDENGVVTAKNSGKVDITVTTEDGRKSDICHVQVYVPVTAVAIKPEPDAMYVGQNEVVNGQWLPKNATNTMFSYVSSNPEIVKINGGNNENAVDDTNYFVLSEIQIECGTVATPFEPYKETTSLIPVSSPLYEGDYIEIFSDGTGKIVRTKGVKVFKGDELFNHEPSWGNSNAFFNGYALSDIKPVSGYATVANVKCSHLRVVTPNYLSSTESADGCIGIGGSKSIYISIPFEAEFINFTTALPHSVSTTLV